MYRLKRTLGIVLLSGGLVAVLAGQSLGESRPLRGSLAGTINGTAFTAVTTGSLDPVTGFIDANVVFDTVPNNYSPMNSLSCLVCLVCCNGAAAINGGVSLLELSDWDYSLTRKLHYSTGDSLETSGTVSTDGDSIIYNATWNGNYNGPIDLTSIPQYHQKMFPGGAGIVPFIGEGIVLRESGDTLGVSWSGQYSFPNNAELPFREISTIRHTVSWDLPTRTYHVSGYSTIEPDHPVPSLTGTGVSVLVILLIGTTVWVLWRRRSRVMA